MTITQTNRPTRVGYYKGYQWSFIPHLDVYPCFGWKTRYYFVRDVSGEYTGDHFRTLAEFYSWVNTQNK